ncbi:ABC transporter [Musa troglodytarum]|uniref:ABC transporter n=1 Tax=Musa troglodytarum TaxID=320322 RepID=A0A9E7EE58_9LILI|nr:ABC transporter [Musa troglodytarum]
MTASADDGIAARDEAELLDDDLHLLGLFLACPRHLYKRCCRALQANTVRGRDVRSTGTVHSLSRRPSSSPRSSASLGPSRSKKRPRKRRPSSRSSASPCRDNIIGSPFVRGVSGGERKRVCIGQEMLVNPSLLFLDKPTSSLDSTIAGRIVSTLADLTKGGRTVATTIHQPSSRLFYMFHKILLLSDGNLVCYDRGSEAMTYFASIDYSPAMPMNLPTSVKTSLMAGLLFFIAGFWAYYASFQAIFTFPQEHTMLSKERSSGVYRLSSYFIASTMVDLPMKLILPTAFSLGLAIVAFVTNIKSGSTLLTVLIEIFQLPSGFYVQNIPRPSFCGSGLESPNKQKEQPETVDAEHIGVTLNLLPYILSPPLDL